MPVEPRADDPRFVALCRKIERDRGFLCSNYKDTCMRRRISVRMRVKGATSFDEYSGILDEDSREYDRLIAVLTINVSKFFRNPETYACIAAKVLPDLWEHSTSPIRIWSAGCALGEETYSLAVLCHQHLKHHEVARRGMSFEVTGTDIDADALSAARLGRYPAASFTDTAPSVRDSYFPVSEGLHTAVPVLRQRVAFHQADLLDMSRAIPRMHLIVCRNVIIYFKREAQGKVIQRFHDALLPGGFLVLGKAESLLGRLRGSFAPVSSRERVYRRS
jgi:chemotaxis protein methyltransferase CheR